MNTKANSNRGVSEKEIEKLAANGFVVSVRLLSYKLECSFEDAMQYVADSLERDIVVIKTYAKTGIKQDRMIERYLNLIHHYQVPIYKYQLRPTKQIIAIQRWSKANV